jgi:hypothetical protein
MISATRKLKVFLCHASQDKPVVREIYKRLLSDARIDPWLDEEKLLPGQDWDLEIEKAVETSDAVIVCLSSRSVSKEGYIQKELRKVLDIALEKPEDAIFVIPLRLDSCELPRRLRSWQYVDYFPAQQQDWAFHRLLESLKLRSDNLQLEKGDESVHPIMIESPPRLKEESRIPANPIEEKRTTGIGWSIPLIIFFSLIALDAFTPSDNTVEILLGISAILAGIAMLVRKQIPELVWFKISLIIFLLVYGTGYRLENLISFAPQIAGLAALISAGILLATMNQPVKTVFYSSISFAVFLFLVGVYLILTKFGYSSITSTIETLKLITGIITPLLLVRDL